jgi:uncharacterized membrane protein YdbT with pleckstrin-like domain
MRAAVPPWRPHRRARRGPRHVSPRALVLRLLRVPPAPSAPGGGGAVHVFRAADNFYRYRLFLWTLTQLGALAGLIFGLVFLRGVTSVGPDLIELARLSITRATTARLVLLAELAAWSGFCIQAVASFALLRLDFEQRWYLVTDRALRIREGLVTLHEKTMTFANIQHLSIEQGPLQRLLGIADLKVRSAGGGSGSGGGAAGQESTAVRQRIAYFRGVSNAAEIRELIRERLRRHADAGLGDPDEVRPVPLADREAVRREAAAVLAAEARALRALTMASATGGG